MEYSEKLLDHFQNPRNVGTLEKDDPTVGTAVIGNPACGDLMQMQVKVNDHGIIEDVKFKTFGCGSAIASSSYTTELVKGRTIEEALQIKNLDVANELNLPPIKIHCSILAEQAIREAIEDYRRKQKARTPGERTESQSGKSSLPI